MIGIDKYAYLSKISRLNPKGKLLFSMLPLLICIFSNSFIVSILTIIIMTYATLVWGGISYKVFLKLILIPIGFLFIGSATIMINRFNLGSPLLIGVSLGSYSYGISYDTLMKGLLITLKSLGAVSCMYFFSLNTPMNDFFNLLRKTKLPVLLIELMELMYRFIFIIWEEGEKIYIAKSSRLGYLGFKNQMYSTGELISSLFLRSFRRIDTINAALESRGFDGSLDTLVEEYSPCKWLNIYTVLVCIILIISYIVERLLF
ncbi:cobalt ECF transporter T component CbiQ [Clostridium cylindrosporum]|uniref:Cobalt ABC transporter, permease protein CbiQ n=1 Tax=Clostridium cylindrosporum DSM 605 TaxID=1121307 RepID=A0A0J8D6Y0_CLOCY|nr:cobalt ECF transporter T component CbiQ [Clostridium cylindrosporum]KMT21830.1 cobalt ABC transporter, permease protein CbiQ [Clostridium cylindrosporum DSM 605]